jgi:hypothetical protein
MAKQRTSRAASDAVELTEGTDATRAQRWSRNNVGPWGAAAELGWSRAQGEREGKRARLRAQMSEESGRPMCGLLKGRGREEVAGERVVVGASTTRGMGERLGTRRGLMGGVHEAERERSCEKKRCRQVGPTEQRERERERVHGLAPTGGTRLSGTEGTRARARIWA